MSEPRQPTAAAYLRRATREAHRAAETTLAGAALNDRRLTRDQYRRLLQTNQSVWAAADAYFSPDTAPAYRPAIRRLRDAARLELDARQWKIPRETPRLTATPPSAAVSMGLLYVLFGSTLGGTLIAGLLPACPELREFTDFRFYGTCAEVARQYWPALRQDLDAALPRDAGRETAAVAARELFRHFEEIYRATADERSGE